MALIETVIDIYGEPVVLADYDTNPPAKVTAIGYPVAADFVAGGLLPAIMLRAVVHRRHRGAHRRRTRRCSAARS